MRRFALLLIVAALVIGLVAPSANAASYVKSEVWQPAWSRQYFPPPPGEWIPYFIAHRVQLPGTVVAGDLVFVIGAEEFSNPSSYTTSGDPFTYAGKRTEHWTTPFFGDCGLVRSASPTGPWADVAHDQGENWDGIQHHWKWHTAAMMLATSSSLAGDYVAIRCRFARNDTYQDPFNDYLVAETGYGRIEAGVVK